MKTKPRELTAAEWFAVRQMRGQKMTGRVMHYTQSKPIKGEPSYIVKGCGPVYFWGWGRQPDAETMKKLTRCCPVKAAQAYLKLFGPGKPRSGI